MYLLILESIGTTELILIAVVALIIFGPRKLPQMAKMLGKTMAEFRNATNEFKTTWEREVSFEDDGAGKAKNTTLLTDTVAVDTKSTVEDNLNSNEENLIQPEVKQLSKEEAEKFFKERSNLPETAPQETKPNPPQSKKDWL